MRTRMLVLTLSFLLLPGTLPADDVTEESRVLTVLEPEAGYESLDPAFEMVMTKVDKDLHYILSSPFRLTPKGTAIVGVTLITTFVLLNNDESYHKDISGNRKDRYDKIYEPLKDLDNYLIEATAGIYLLGYLLDDSGVKSDALLGLESAALAALFTAVPAYVIGRSPPEDSADGDDYDPFEKIGSLPDVGSAMVFSVASSLSRDGSILSSVFWYSLATGVGLSRVYYDDAWPSDVFLGAAIGTAIGWTVAGLSRGNSESRVSFSPVVTASSSGHGLGVTVRF